MSIEQERAEFEAALGRGKTYTERDYQMYLLGRRAALQSQDRDKDRIDAERYRWLRADNAYFPEENHILGGQELDEAIDHARRVEGERNARALD